jgi:hypothetical protein
MPETLVIGSAAEVVSTYPAQVASTHRAAEMTPAYPAVKVATTAASTCKARSRSDDTGDR